MNSSLFTPRRIFTAIGILVLLLLLRQCLKNRDGGTPATNVVNIRFDSAPSNLNPYLTVVGADLYICTRLFQGLGDLDPKALDLQPLIIQKIPVVRTVQDGPHAGQLAYDFEILPEAVWDNNTPITGNDMAFTLKLILHPLLDTKAFMSYFKDLGGLDIDPANPKKFTVYFKQYYILALESICQIPIMPAYNYDPSNRLGKASVNDLLDSVKVNAYKTDPDMIAFAEEYKQPKFTNDLNAISGSNAYRVVTMNDQGAILEKKKNWWGDKLSAQRPLLSAYPEKLVYKVVKDENVIENMLKNGELDLVASSLSGTKFLEMKSKDSLNTRYDFELLPALAYNRWAFNLSKPNLQDVRVRKALAHIVDYDHFIKNIRANLAVRIVGPILPAKRYYAKDLTPYDFNIQKAKDLLAQAGWTDSNGDGVVDKTINGVNTKLVIEVLVPPIRTNQQYAESVTETARQAGIEIKTVTADINDISPKTKSGDFETAFLSAALFPGLSELSQRYHSKYLAPKGDNRSRYINPKFDALLEQIASETDDAKRDVMYIEAQKILAEDLPEVFLFAPSQPIVTSKKFDAVLTSNRPGYYEHLFKLK